MRRGEVWWANLPGPAGSGPGYRRPVVIVQANPFNASRLQTVVAAIITSNVRLKELPGNVVLGRRESGLPKQSVVNVTQIVTVDRSFLVKRIRGLPAKLMAEVDAGLRLVLAL
jgi:mRNA interferase MazF